MTGSLTSDTTTSMPPRRKSGQLSEVSGCYHSHAIAVNKKGARRQRLRLPSTENRLFYFRGILSAQRISVSAARPWVARWSIYVQAGLPMPPRQLQTLARQPSKTTLLAG